MKEDNYEDIINLPRPVSTKHPRLSMEQRAAQFAPFATLTGHSDMVNETARLTDGRIEIDEEVKIELDEKLAIIQNEIDKKPIITISYFIKDTKKSGGKYVDVTGVVKKIDRFKNKIVLENLLEIPIKDILIIEGDILRDF